MQTSYQYRAFGLNIRSDHPVHSLMESEIGDTDVIIRRGNVAEQLGGTVLETKYKNWQASKNTFLLEVHGIAKYLVRNGNEIWIQPVPGTTEDDIAAFLMGSTLAALLQQREILTLHASAIRTPRGAVLFLGKSGAGKSTTLSAMLAKGYGMITDDVSAISVDGDGDFFIQPGFPTTRLWGDALAKLGKSQDEGRQLRAELNKFLIPVERFCQKPQKVERIFLLDIHPWPDIRIELVSYAESIQWLTKYTFRQNFYRGHGLQHFHFHAMSGLAKSVPMCKIGRPEKPVLLDQLVEEIISVLQT